MGEAGWGGVPGELLSRLTTTPLGRRGPTGGNRVVTDGGSDAPPLGRLLVEEHQLMVPPNGCLTSESGRAGEPAQKVRYVPEADLSIGHAKTSNSALA